MDLTGGPIDDTDSDDDIVSLSIDDGDKADAKPTSTPASDAPPESINLAELMTEDELKKISARVCTDFDADVDSGSKHMERLRRWVELYESVMHAKTWPFDRAANVNVPLVTYTVLQIQGRLFDMTIPSKGEIFHSLPTDQRPEELDRANRTELYMNYLARHEIPEFTQVYDEILFQMSIYGSTFSTWNWDEVENRPVPECVSAEDMVVPFDAKSRSPQMKGVPRYTRVRWMTYYDIQDKGDDGFFVNTDKVHPTKTKTKGDEEFREATKEISGLEKTSYATEEDEQRQVLEQHIRWLKLPNDPKRHSSFDGNPHAVIVWEDAESEAVMRIVLREEEDPKDKLRFQKEDAAYQGYVQAKAIHEASGGVTMDPNTGSLVPVPEPAAVQEPRPVRHREITFFTHWRAFPSQGFYGLGYGGMVGPLNEALNAIVNQNIDRGTVNNSRGGFVSRQLRFQRGPILMQPGQYVEIDAPPAAMKDGLQTMPAIPSDPDMVRMVEKIEEWGQRSAGSGDTLSGEPIGANETAKAAMLRNENAQKQISVLGSRVIGYMKNDVEMLWRILSVFLPDDADANVPGKDGQPTPIKISRADFIADMRVFPAADPRVTTKDQRIQDADGALAMAMQNPMLAQNPQIIHALTERQLHARDMADLVPLLAPQPPPPPPPVPQEDENAAFLKGEMPQVNPADNDDEHLSKIETFKRSPEFQAMTPEMTNAMDTHARHHIAQKMTKESANARATGNQIPGPPGGGPPGMAGPPGNPAVPPGAQGAHPVG